MLPFESELKQNLCRLAELQDQKELIDKEIDNIRQGINTWLKGNELTEFNCADNNNQNWKLSLITRKNTKVNKDILPLLLSPDDLNKVLTIVETTSLMCKRVISKTNMPSAPIGV